MTEQLPDIVLACTDGTPTAAGRPLPTYQFVISSTVPFTSRNLRPGSPTSGYTEALLLVDEPDFLFQIGCEPKGTAEGCTAVAGSSLNSNVFEGRQIQNNNIAFRSIPLDPPGPGRTRTVRLTNLRVNVPVTGTLTPPQEIRISVQVFGTDGNVVTVKDPSLVTVTSVAGVSFSVRTAGDLAPPLQGLPALTVPPAALGTTPQVAQSFLAKFTEGFAGAFKRRNVGTSADNPLFMTVQAAPGAVNGTESGFFNNLLPGGQGMDQAGLADSGTRLRLHFEGIPKDVAVWVSPRDVAIGTTAYSLLRPKAILTPTDTNGAGAFSPVKTANNALVQLQATNGAATAVWEIVSSDLTAIQDVSFMVAITALSAQPGQGTVLATASLAPMASAILSTGPVTIPVFKDPGGPPVRAFAVSNLITLPGFASVNAASFDGNTAAPGSLASGFGRGLAAVTAVASGIPLPTTIGNTTVQVIDSSGVLRDSALYLISPTQINYYLDPATSVGLSLVTVLANNVLVASGPLEIEKVAPALFSANGNGTGVAAAEVLRNNGKSTLSQPAAIYDRSLQQWVATPIDVGSDLVFLALYGTGIRNRTSLSDVRVTVGGADLPVTYAGPQSDYPGLDQVNAGPIPKTLAGSGVLRINLTVSGLAANFVTVYVK